MKIGRHGRRSAAEVRFDRAFGAAIRRRREDLGLSLVDLGAAIGQSFQQVQKYEQGVNSVKVCRLLAVAKALETTPAALVAEGQVDYGEAAGGADRAIGVFMRRYAAAPLAVRKAVFALLATAAKDQDGIAAADGERA